MKFSEYIILEKVGSSVDPLGFLSPSSQISSKLFKQFTVLSNHPSYLGLLCHIYSYLEEQDLYPGKARFAERFRDLESLWGIINSLNGTSVLNVTKFNKYTSNPAVTLDEVRENRLLYAKLQYGTLGHYSTPARTWELLDRKGIHLTNLGRTLGGKWGQRNGKDFKELLKKWDDGKSINDIQATGMDIKAFSVQSAATTEERETWREAIDSYCAKRAEIAPLWQEPLPTEILASNKEEKKYPGFFKGAAAHFSKYETLRTRIEQAELFEKLAAFVQFTFEFEYCKRGETGQDIFNNQNEVEKELAGLLSKFAANYLSIPAAPQPLSLFSSISQEKTYKGLVQCILGHHARHQRKKGAKAYMDDSSILVNNRVEPQKVSDLLEEFSSSSSSFISKIIWRYSRDWHFDRAALWNSYAGRGE